MKFNIVSGFLMMLFVQSTFAYPMNNLPFRKLIIGGEGISFTDVKKEANLPDSIEITYHVGYRTSWISYCIEKRGAFTRTEKIVYHLQKPKKGYKPGRLNIETTLRRYDNGKFGNNLRSDSIQNKKVLKRMKTGDIRRLISLINKVRHPVLDTVRADSFQVIFPLEKQILSDLDHKTFGLTNRKLNKLKRHGPDKFQKLSNDSLFTKIVKFVIKENEGILVSSITEWMHFSFFYQGNYYRLSQNYPWGMRLSWQVDINDTTYFVISPEMNRMIHKLLPWQMTMKEKLLNFTKFKTLKACIAQPDFI